MFYFLVRGILDFKEKNITKIKDFIRLNWGGNKMRVFAHFGKIEGKIDWLHR